MSEQKFDELIDACKKGDFQKIKSLVDADPSLVKMKTKHEGYTPLHYGKPTIKF